MDDAFLFAIIVNYCEQIKIIILAGTGRLALHPGRGATGPLLLVVATEPFVDPALNGLFWFFTYRFTLWLVLLPLFALLGAAIPVVTCRTARRHSVVERLRVE